MKIVHDMLMADYLADPSLSASGVVRLLKSPLHFHSGEQKETDALRFGAALHCAALEPARFERDYVIWDGPDHRGNKYKDFKAAFASRPIIDAADKLEIAAMVNAMRAHPVSSQYLTGCKSEVSVFWDQDGVPCKARFDGLRYDAILEIKTTRDAETKTFIRRAFNLGYHIKAAWYQRAALVCLDPDIGRLPVIVITVENVQPYDVVVYEVPDYALELALTDCEAALATYRKCAASNRWPGIADTLQVLDLPKWAYKDDIEQTTLTIEGVQVEV